MRLQEINCWKIAFSLQKKFGGEIWRLTPRFGLYVDRAHEPVSGTIDDVFGSIENWTEHAVYVKDGFVRDPMMLGHDEPIPLEEWQIHWNHFECHNFVRIH